MFDIGWTELLLIGIVALIVVGPKDLPRLFRTLGKVTGRIRAMASEFQRSLEQAADETGVRDMARDLRESADPGRFGLGDIDRSAEELLAEDKEDSSAKGDGDAPWTPDPDAPGPEVAKPVTLPSEKVAEAAAGAAAANPAEEKGTG